MSTNCTQACACTRMHAHTCTLRWNWETGRRDLERATKGTDKSQEEIGCERWFKRLERVRMSYGKRQLVPGRRALVWKRMLSIRFGSEGWDSEKTSVIRRTKLVTVLFQYSFKHMAFSDVHWMNWWGRQTCSFNPMFDLSLLWFYCVVICRTISKAHFETSKCSLLSSSIP